MHSHAEGIHPEWHSHGDVTNERRHLRMVGNSGDGDGDGDGHEGATCRCSIRFAVFSWREHDSESGICLMAAIIGECHFFHLHLHHHHHTLSVFLKKRILGGI